MSQLTIYLDSETAARMRQAAASEGVSQSQWIARLIHERLSTSWPESVKQLAGAWPDMPGAEELRQGQGDDLLRETW